MLWTTSEFGWVELDDAFATGSSIMPQKKNPDVAELARGKSGRIIGHLTGLLATLKGLPLAYDRDLQEDKEPVFDAVDTLRLVLAALRGAVETMHVHAGRIEEAAPRGFSLATDAAEYLVRQGVPFREAHEAVGRLVALCDRQESALGEVSDEQMRKVSPVLTPDVRSVLTVRGALEARSGYGGTAPERVLAQLRDVQREIDSGRAWVTRVDVVLTPLPRQFYDRPVVDVARGLLGAVLESALGGELVRIRLTEVEAYGGVADPASHAFRGPSARNRTMFGPPGRTYVYFTYGMHFCMNLVTGAAGTASAVLLRAGTVIDGADVVARRRPGVRSRDYARGPARLTRALNVDKAADGADVCTTDGPLRVLPSCRCGRPDHPLRAPGWRHDGHGRAVAVLAAR